MASKYEMYDNAFLGILQNEGNIVTFLDALFSFLYRRTDFYLVMNSPTDKMGFPPGVAKKNVLAAYKKYETLAESRKPKEKKCEVSSSVKTCAPDPGPPVARVEEVATSSSGNNVAASDSSSTRNSSHPETEDSDTVDSSNTLPSTQPLPQQNSDVAVPSDHSDAAVEDAGKPECSASAACDSKPSSQLPAGDGNTDPQDDNPELTLQQKKYQLNPESYNGAVRDHYSWSQSISDVDVRVKVPCHVQRGADVTVEIARKRLRVLYKAADKKTSVEAIDSELTWDIHKDESMWSLVPGEHIHINLEKVQERWWEAVLVDEPKISVRKIDASRPMTDLDDEAQAKIDELMYNEHQKRLGLPQSHEKKVHDILRQAWDVEGSPFKGQPFDPSVVNVSPGGM